MAALLIGGCVLLESRLGGLMEYPVVGIDAAGVAHAVWMQASDGDRPNVWASRFE